MRLKFFNKETGEEMEGQYLIEDDGTIWKYEFGSCDSATEPTRAWAGEMWKIKHPVKVIIEVCA